MSISLVVATASGSTDGHNFTTAAINTSGASLLVVALAQYNVGGTITDSFSNTWVKMTEYTGGAGGTSDGVVLLYCAHPTVGAGHTFTTTGDGYPALAVAAFSGTLDAQAAEFDEGTANGSATTIQPGSKTPANNNEVVVTAVTTNTAAGTFAIDSSFLIAAQVSTVGNQHVAAGLGYIVQTTAGAVNPTWSGVTGYAVAMTSFQAAAVAIQGDAITMVL